MAEYSCYVAVSLQEMTPSPVSSTHAEGLPEDSWFRLPGSFTQGRFVPFYPLSRPLLVAGRTNQRNLRVPKTAQMTCRLVCPL